MRKLAGSLWLVCQIAALCVALMAQKPTKFMVPECHMSGSHPCHCMERANKIAVAAAEVCNGPHWRDYYKTKAECYLAKLPGTDHCSVAEAWTDYDVESGEAEDLDGRLVASSTMGSMCSMACKKHDCKCDGDGPTCHFGHTAKDHEK